MTAVGAAAVQGMGARDPDAGDLLAAPSGPGEPGVSVVTCCRNRSANLIRALPSWLACAEVAEVVVVDWGSDRPVAADLAAAGLTDPRIRLVRAEDEPRWILSLAFNLGFRLARCARVLKADADIVLERDFFARNPLPPMAFVAGNWRRTDPGQAYVNGVFYIRAGDLRAVNGFNEYITTYGWDDDDLYDRLVAAGITRVDVDPGSVTHLDHDDAARLNHATPETPSGWADLGQMAMFRIRTNRMLATMMPPWNRDRVMQPFRWRRVGAGRLSVERAGVSIHRVPPEQQAIAEQLAACEMLAWRVGLRAYELTGRQLDLLLTCCRFDDISALRVELMLAGAGLAAAVAPRHLVLDLDEGVLAAGPARLAPLAERVAAIARHAGRVPVWRAPRARPPESLPPALADLAFVPLWQPIGPATDLDLAAAARDPAAAVLRLVPRLSDLEAIGPPALPRPALPAPALPAPAVSVPRRRLFIDVQHGLGNRLRALGSAHAVAEATGRDLVVVWQPDEHCRARLEDLFMPGAAGTGPGIAGVIPESFAARAAAEGATLLSYMEIEPGAAKGAPLVLDEGRDAYVRSAYVINHPASTWDSENRLLRRLTPSAAVADLMAGVPDHRDIGLHVRTEPATGDSVPSHDAPHNWTPEGHAQIVHWRAQSRPDRFVARLDALLAQTPGARIFLAADTAGTYQAFGDIYGARLAHLARPVFDRSVLQAQYALADLLLLARCRHLLGSNWSSFTEAALRLSTSIAVHERAGVDF